jgi:hypothetical protein
MELSLQSPGALLAAALAAAAAVVFVLWHTLLRAPAAAGRRSCTPVLHAIGTATPSRSLVGSEFLEIVKSLDYPEAMQGKMERLVAGSGISRRFCVSPAPVGEYVATMCGEGARGKLWDTCVPGLAVAAARDALARWRHGSAQDVTHVVVHSCTGFSAPGLDFAIIRALGLRSSTRKIGVNFMGWCVLAGGAIEAPQQQRGTRGPPRRVPLAAGQPSPPWPNAIPPHHHTPTWPSLAFSSPFSTTLKHPTAALAA